MMWHIVFGLQLTLLFSNCQSVNSSLQDRLPYQVRFVKSGGISGAINQLDIDLNGQISYKKNQLQSASSLTKEEVSTLKQLIIAIDTVNLKPEYKPEGKTFDGFKYTLTLGSTTTVIHERSVPAHLQQIVKFLNGIFK